MILTEEEAKTRWCPFARQLMRAGDTWAPANRDRDYDDMCLCIASQCMAWRWNNAMSEAEFVKMATTGETKAPVGFCGLAGKVEQ
jgi:hypothetical protein